MKSSKIKLMEDLFVSVMYNWNINNHKYVHRLPAKLIPSQDFITGASQIFVQNRMSLFNRQIKQENVKNITLSDRIYLQI